MSRAKRSGKYADRSHKYAETAFNGCRVRRWRDLSASEVERFIGELVIPKRGRRDPGRRMSARTRNEYLRACKQFCGRMIRDRRAASSPRAHLQRENIEADRRLERRPLTPDELRCLLRVTRDEPDRSGMTGRARYLLYLFATETGLRSGEIRSLCWGAFKLDADTPNVTIAAAYSKNRREDTFPLRPATAQLLAAWRDATARGDSQKQGPSCSTRRTART